MDEFFRKIVLPRLDVTKVKVFQLYEPRKSNLTNVFSLRCHLCSLPSAVYVHGSGEVICSNCRSTSSLFDLLGTERSESAKYSIFLLAAGLPSKAHQVRFRQFNFQDHLKACSAKLRYKLSFMGVPKGVAVGFVSKAIAKAEMIPAYSGCLSLPWYSSPGAFQCSLYRIDNDSIRLRYEPFYFKSSFEPANFKRFRGEKELLVVTDHLVASIVSALFGPCVAIGYISQDFCLGYLKQNAQGKKLTFVLGSDEQLLRERLAGYRFNRSTIISLDMNLDASKVSIEYPSIQSFVGLALGKDLGLSRASAVHALQYALTLLEADSNLSIGGAIDAVYKHCGIKLRLEM